MTIEVVKHRLAESSGWGANTLHAGSLGVLTDPATGAAIGFKLGGATDALWNAVALIELFTTALKAKLDAIEAGAQVNPDQVTHAEIDAHTGTALRSWSPADVAYAISALGAAAVVSVFGRSGVVVAGAGDYTADQITDTANKVLMTTTERAKLAGVGAGANVTSVAGHTGVVTLSADDIGSDGTTYKRFLATEQTKLSGIATAADVALAVFDTAANFAAANAVHAKRLLFETDTKCLKIGDATTAYNSLPWLRWFRAGGASAEVNNTASAIDLIPSTTMAANLLELDGNKITFRWVGYIRNETGGGHTVTITINVGGTAVAVDVSSSTGTAAAVNRVMTIEGEIYRIAANTIWIVMHHWEHVADAATTGVGDLTASSLSPGRLLASSYAGTSVTLSSPWTFGVTGTLDTANAALGVKTNAWNVSNG